MRPKYLCPCVTAFHPDGSLDFAAQAAVYDALIAGGIDGILVLGSMGEFFALTDRQRHELTEFSISHIAGRTKVMVGATAMRFEDTVQLSRHALQAGADSVAVISPYYLKLTQPELIAYYDRLADEVDGPIYLYNYPDRTVHDMDAETVLAIRRKHDNVVGIKDSAPTAEHTIQIVKTVCPEYPDFEVYCGFDNYLPAVYAAGGTGAIGGLSNVAPALLHQWCQAIGDGDAPLQAALTAQVEKLMGLYYVGMPFSPYIKEAVRLTGIPMDNGSTFPLPRATAEESARVAAILKDAGVSIG